MRIRLTQPIVGYKQGNETEPRIHANKDDILQVILNNPTHFICDSLNYPEQAIIVFKSQCIVINALGLEKIIEDPYYEEKYYHVYEDKSKQKLDDPFHTAFEFDDPE